MVTAAQVGLGNVDNTTDLLKPISTATQTALNSKVDDSQVLTNVPAGAVFTDTVYSLPVASPTVLGGVKAGTNIAIDGNGVISANDTSVAFTEITGKPTTLTGYGVTDAINVSQKGVVNGVATLDENGLVPATQLPSYVDDVLEFATLSVFPVTGVSGKIYVDTATNKTYRWSGTVYIYITSGAVDSVAGKTGIVTLVKGDVGLGSADNTSDANKPVSTAQASAIALKANIASPVFTGNVTGLGVATGTSFNSITGLASVAPAMDGTAAIGASATVARQDHVHPTDTSRAAAATSVSKDSDTGVAYLPAGTTAQRPTLASNIQAIRYNTDLLSFEGWSGMAWGSLGGGATGGGTDKVFNENEYVVTANYTIPAGKSAKTVPDASGNVTINSGVSVTISAGSRWEI
jgi:hypothetical protein